MKAFKDRVFEAVHAFKEADDYDVKYDVKQTCEVKDADGNLVFSASKGKSGDVEVFFKTNGVAFYAEKPKGNDINIYTYDTAEEAWHPDYEGWDENLEEFIKKLS